MEGLLHWVSSLPAAALYLVMGVAATLENIFPPLPADTVVAFGSFLAARGSGTIVGAFLATWIGNLAGASLMYGAGRKYGAARVDKRLFGNTGAEAESRLEALYTRYGMPAIFVSRFIPGARALVPPFAGAFRLPFVQSLVVMGVASGIWYGVISYLAFRAGANWSTLQQEISRYGKVAAVAAIVIVVVVVAIRWFGRARASERGSGR